MFIKAAEYTALVRAAAVADLLRSEVARLQEDNRRLVDIITHLKQAGYEMAPGAMDEGFGRYSFDEIEEEEADEPLQPTHRLSDLDDSVPQDELDDLARAMGYDPSQR